MSMRSVMILEIKADKSVSRVTIDNILIEFEDGTTSVSTVTPNNTSPEQPELMKPVKDIEDIPPEMLDMNF